MKLTRTTSENKDFQKLTALFDEYLIDIDGDEKDFFAQYNHVYLENVVVCYDDSIAVGCGAFKKHENNTAEIKRMFVHPEHRGKGVANLILKELELWAIELENTNAILETSIKLKAAIALYLKSGYIPIENYGQYIGVESSYCMKKILK
ncbi:GNAT family N-acetyltransferase [Flavobacterium sp.]|uniref:GNAT family N-acetyltransferase n=1 Tax=Flavobacterium sp. TaxID=239 RepID=UPI00286D7D87|nr:GNAT family N-acetyltransferase [Flavobacterium sp.]